MIMRHVPGSEGAVLDGGEGGGTEVGGVSEVNLTRGGSEEGGDHVTFEEWHWVGLTFHGCLISLSSCNRTTPTLGPHPPEVLLERHSAFLVLLPVQYRGV